MELNNSQGKIDAKNLSKRIGDFVVKKESLVLMLIALIFIGYLGQLWYKYDYNYQWDEIEKQTYIKSKQTGVEFEKEKFEEVLKDVQVRQENYKKDLEVTSDIFRLNK